MISRRLTTTTAALGLLLSPVVFAQDEDGATDDLELTIRLIPEGATDGSEISRTITLPERVPERVPRTVPGENAGEDVEGDDGDLPTLPERVEAPGLEIAEDARAGELRDRAREIREEVGRGEGPPENLPPGDRPVPEDLPRPDGPGDAGDPPVDLPEQAESPTAEDLPAPVDDLPSPAGQ